MKKTSFVLCLGWFSALFAIVPAAAAPNADFTALALHESLGQMIDAEENLRYLIFGDIDGFTAAKIYPIDADKYRMHLLRNAGERAQMVFVDLPAESFLQLRAGVQTRIDRALDEDAQFKEALFPIEEAKWTESGVNKKLVLRDGSQLIGVFKRAQGDTLIVETAGGLQIALPDMQISQIIDLRGEVREGKFFRLDPNTSRLFFSPTGRSLKSGNGYFADYYIFFPTLAYGITDYFSLSGGISLLPGSTSQLIMLAPKFTFPLSPRVGVGAGFMYLTLTKEDGSLKLFYAVTTIGDDRSAITLGAGVPIVADAEEGGFILLAGAERQISNSVKLISENWIISAEETAVLFSGGVRFFGERLAVDIALMTMKEAFEEGGFPFIPWVDFSVFFGK